MQRYFILLLLLFSSCYVFSQSMAIMGNVQDTTAKKPLQYAVAMAIKLKDSTLVKFTRTNENGMFKLYPVPIDTYQVIISHSKFGEQVFIVVGNEKNTEFDLGKIVLPPKNYTLNEVTILGFKDPVYFKPKFYSPTL